MPARHSNADVQLGKPLVLSQPTVRTDTFDHSRKA